MAATAGGEVYTWGAHGHGQLGQGALGPDAQHGCLARPARVAALGGHPIRQVVPPKIGTVPNPQKPPWLATLIHRTILNSTPQTYPT